MNMKKRIAAMLILALAVSCLCAGAFANSWNLTDVAIGDGVTEEHLRRGRPNTIAKWWAWEHPYCRWWMTVGARYR